MLDGNNLGITGELQWLEDSLLASAAKWKIIFTSVITNPTTKQDDAWGAYQTEWNALREFINLNNIYGVVFVSGDLHLGAIDNGTEAGFPEMSVTAANQTQTGFCATAARGIWSEGYYDEDCAGYGLVTVLQNPDRLILQVMDQYGNAKVSYTVAGVIPPSITSQPRNTRVNEGRRAKFSVTATGTLPLQYQWTKNGKTIAGATRSSYTTPPTTEDDNGALFAVIVSNSVGSVTSNNAKLKVRPTTTPMANTFRHLVPARA